MHEYIHKRDNERRDSYKQIGQYYFKDFELDEIPEKLKAEIISNNLVNLSFNFKSKLDEKNPGKAKLRFKKNHNLKCVSDLCVECLGSVVKRIPQKSNLKKTQTFYYEYYFYCQNCNLMFMVVDAKRSII